MRGATAVLDEVAFDEAEAGLSTGEIDERAFLTAYLSAEELGTHADLGREIAALDTGRLEIVDVLAASSLGVAGYLTQYALQDLFYEQVKSFAEWVDQFKGGSHPIDRVMAEFPKGSRGFHRLVYHDAFAFTSENPFWYNLQNIDRPWPVVILQTAVHLFADLLTKRGLPLPGLGNLPSEWRIKLWKEHVTVYRDLMEVNIGDLAGLGVVKFSTDWLAKRRGIGLESVARHELKFVGYTSYAATSAILGSPNPLAFGVASWAGLQTLRNSRKLSFAIGDRADLVNTAVDRLFVETTRTDREAAWASSLASGAPLVEWAGRREQQESDRAAAAAKWSVKWSQ